MNLSSTDKKTGSIKIETSWKDKLSDEFGKEYFSKLKSFLNEERLNGFKIFPAGNRIFTAFNLTPFNQVKVVILGQDPYHGLDQANGLCFSVNEGIRTPPSLVNIYKELLTDLGVPIASTGNLEPWARQGVLLLNATLTVRENQAGSHHHKGWEDFTNAVISKISTDAHDVVFLLWGRFAQEKKSLIDTSKHLVLKAAHPSPLARGAFFGCRHFSLANSYLALKGKTLVNWRIE